MRRLASLALLAVLALTGCDSDESKKGECLNTETVTGTTVVFNGKTTVPVITVTTICTERAPAEVQP